MAIPTECTTLCCSEQPVKRKTDTVSLGWRGEGKGSSQVQFVAAAYEKIRSLTKKGKLFFLKKKDDDDHEKYENSTACSEHRNLKKKNQQFESAHRKLQK